MNKNSRYKVITLCGSTRFKDAFIEVQKALTLKGYIVISVGLFGHSGDTEVWTEGTKEMLDDMHKRKIDMADEICVIDVGGYIGSSTMSEIEYAMAHGKPVHYYSARDLLSDFKPTISKKEDACWIKMRERVYGGGRGYTHCCSNCGGRHGFGDERYCPDCGIKMKESAE
jgi:hypothetical protein